MSTPSSIASETQPTLDELQRQNALLQQALEEEETELEVQRALLSVREQENALLQEKLSLFLSKRYSHCS